MARTIRRQPFNISTSSSNYPKSYFLNQTHFSGLCTNKNDTNIDAQSLSDVKNVYVDDDGTLTSRASFRFLDNEINIIRQWRFGEYRLCLYKVLCRVENGRCTVLSSLSSTDYYRDKDNLCIVYSLRCTSHDTEDRINNAANIRHYGEYCIKLQASVFGDDYSTFLSNYNDLYPDVFCEQVENRIFIWVAGIDFIALNVTGEIGFDGKHKLYFEDAKKYLYVPTHIVNTGNQRITLESKNKLTSAYFERYQYSSLLPVTFASLAGKTVRVSTAEDTLYDYTIEDEASVKALLYPVLVIGTHKTHVAETPHTLVILQEIEDETFGNHLAVSYGAGSFTRIPSIPGHTLDYYYDKIYLTKDGMHVVVMSKYYWYSCPLVSSSTEEFVEEEFTWTQREYQKHEADVNADKQQGITVVGAQFDTIDNYAMCLRGPVSVYIVYNDGATEKLLIVGENGETNLVATFSGRNLFTGDLGKKDKFCFSLYEGVPCCTYVQDDQTIIIYDKTICTADEGKLGFDNYSNRKDIDWTNYDITITRYHSKDNTGTFVWLYSIQKAKEGKSLYGVRIEYQVTKNAEGKIVFGRTNHETQLAADIDVAECTYKAYDEIRYANNAVINGKNIPLPVSNKNKCITVTASGAYYHIDDKLWTTAPGTTLVNLDVYRGDENNGFTANLSVPEHSAMLGERYFSFNDRENNIHKLEITDTRRDVNTLDYAWYLPLDNEQKFADKITNLHPLSDTMIGIFTPASIWYVSAVTLDDANIAYTAPMKSRIPCGCREGDEILTTADGQTIIFATPQGIAALAPQDFIATTEKSVSYITDNIYDKYYRFYLQRAEGYTPKICMIVYKKYLLFYKYMQREILVFNMQDASWWVWETQYPLLSLDVDANLRALMQVDFLISSRLSLQGVKFIFTDRGFYDIEYRDSTITVIDDRGISVNTTNGVIVDKGNSKMSIPILQPVSSMIDWYLISQRLHFGLINEYKAIKGLNINVKDMENFCAKLYSKIYRNVSNPEYAEMVEFDIKDLRTFIKRLNFLNVINFQYALQNNTESDTPYQLKLNSISVKYEIKEQIR